MTALTAQSATAPRLAADRGGLDSARGGELLVELNSEGTTDRRRTELREMLVDLYAPLTRHLARRFHNRGEPLDDLIQVAYIGLLKAIDGFDPERGVGFTSYAIPTINGEIKRHFRDKGWSMRVPRRLKEMKLEVTKATGTLTQDLGRTVTDTDLVNYLGTTAAEIRECHLSAHAYSATSLSAPVNSGISDHTLADVMGNTDAGMETVENRALLRPLIAGLTSRQRRILGLRFYANLTQSQIAERVGISQMHVSRLLTKTLAQLRDGVTVDV